MSEHGPHCETCTCGCACGYGGHHEPENPHCELNWDEAPTGHSEASDERRCLAVQRSSFRLREAAASTSPTDRPSPQRSTTDYPSSRPALEAAASPSSAERALADDLAATSTSPNTNGIGSGLDAAGRVPPVVVGPLPGTARQQ